MIAHNAFLTRFLQAMKGFSVATSFKGYKNPDLYFLTSFQDPQCIYAKEWKIMAVSLSRFWLYDLYYENILVIQ